VIGAQMTMKPWELPKWAREQAGRLGLSLDAAAAKALVDQVGNRQQRLLRELEKLALEGAFKDAGRQAGARIVEVAEIEARAAYSAEVPGLRAGRCPGGRRWAGCDAELPAVASRRAPGRPELSDGRPGCVRRWISLRLAAGDSLAEVKRGLRMPARAAERLVADVAPQRPRTASGGAANPGRAGAGHPRRLAACGKGATRSPSSRRTHWPAGYRADLPVRARR